MSTEFMTPPTARGRQGVGLVSAALSGNFCLQHCLDCGRVQYPQREVCSNCLSADLVWRETDNEGTVHGVTRLHVSGREYFSKRTPWPIALVRSVDECSIIVHALGNFEIGQKVLLSARIDRAGRAVICAEAADQKHSGEASGSEVSLNSDEFLNSAREQNLIFLGDSQYSLELIEAGLQGSARRIVVPDSLVDNPGLPRDGRIVRASEDAGSDEGWIVRTDFD